MTRLSIQSRNEINNISIHLRPGQSCTIGSSGAADYCLDDQTISGIFCRLRCHASGGFIECIDPSKAIVVNQKSKNRSRLVNGDSLTIGRTKLDVEMPQLEISNADFHFSFEDEESPSTISDDSMSGTSLERENPRLFDTASHAIDLESNGEADPPANSSEKTDSNRLFDDFDETEEDEHEMPNAGPIESPSDFASSFKDDQDDEPAFSFGPSRFDEDDTVRDDSPQPSERSPSSEFDSESPELDRESSTDPAVPSKTLDQDAVDVDGSPLFSFDSNDPDDVELSDTDLAEIYDDSQIETFPSMSVSISDANETAESDSISVSLDHDVDLSLLDGSFDDQTGDSHLQGGQDTGKFWRWQGSSLLSAIDHVLDTLPRLNAFRVRGVQTQPEAISTLRSHTFLEEGSAIFLVTNLSMDELQNTIRINRWDDRMGHPRALKMFLEYAPGSVLGPFFNAVDSVLLVEDGDPLLIRRDTRIA